MEWAAYARTVRRLPGTEVAAPVEAAAAVVSAKRDPAAAVPVRRQPAVQRPVVPPPVGRAPAGLDRATWERFRSGQLAPARRLDLHGMTAAVAHPAVTRFILGAHATGLRCVEIVTGVGSTAGAGTLRREFPHWLAAPGLAHLILAATHSRGNVGATRLLLRRTR